MIVADVIHSMQYFGALRFVGH